VWRRSLTETRYGGEAENSRTQELKKSGAAGKRQKAKGKRQKLFVFCSIDEYPSQLDAGEKVFLAHQPNFFNSAFCLLTFAFREVEKSTSREVKKPRGRPPILEFLTSWLLDFFPSVPILL
jgi:hypothetical protein